MIDDLGKVTRLASAVAIAIAAGAVCVGASPSRLDPQDEVVPVVIRRSSAFLPVIGPAPLRFSVTPPPLRSNTLPPLAMSDPVVPVPTNSIADSASLELLGPPIPSTTNTLTLAAASGPLPVPQLAATAGTNAVAPLVASPFAVPSLSDTNEPPVLSPQMLVRFFTQPGTTNRSMSVALPVGFDPARPITPPSSSATYTSH